MASVTMRSLWGRSSETEDASSRGSVLPYSHGLDGVNLGVNDTTTRALWSSIVFLIVVILLVRSWHLLHKEVRHVTTIGSNKDHQRYWSQESRVRAKFLKNIVVAPLIRKRHNREIRLSAAVNVGTLPSRLHTLLLVSYLLSNIAYCLLLNYDHQSRAALIAEVRGRTGHLAVINMLALFVLAARNNPLIPLLGISFDTFNLFHRWIGRIIVLESTGHTIAWFLNKRDAVGWSGLRDGFMSDAFLQFGLLAFIAMALILLQSPSAIRHAFYELFLHLHQFLALVALVAVTLHVTNHALPQVPIMFTIFGIWGSERIIRLARIFYHNISSKGMTRLYVQALDGGACRATFEIPATWSRSPGQYIFAYIPAVSLWMSHPFSVAWVDNNPMDLTLDNDRSLASTISSDVEAQSKHLPPSMRNFSQVSCIIAARTGMTGALYRRANASPTKSISLRAFIEGPYGGSSASSLRSYGTVLLFAGGVGITNQLSHVKDLLTAHQEHTCSTRRIVLVWSVRTAEQLQWVKPWMDDLQKMSGKDGIFRLLIYVTQRKSVDLRISNSGQDRQKQHSSEEHRRGRPDIKRIVQEEFEDRIGAMTIGVCGPGPLADDVRYAARGVMVKGKADFWEEAFTW